MIMGLFLSWNVDFNVDITFILWDERCVIIEISKIILRKKG